MDAHAWARQAAARVVGVGHGVEEVAADEIHEVDLAARRGVERVRRLEPLVVRDGVPPGGLELGAALVADLDAARQLVGVDAALGGALHARVAANRDDAGLLAPDVAARQRQVDHHLHVVDAERVLRQAHRVEQHRALGLAVELGEALDLRVRQAGRVADLAPRARAHLFAQLLEAEGALFDEASRRSGRAHRAP